MEISTNDVLSSNFFFCGSDSKKGAGNGSYYNIAFKFNFTANQFVLEAGIVVIKYEVQ